MPGRLRRNIIGLSGEGGEVSRQRIPRSQEQARTGRRIAPLKDQLKGSLMLSLESSTARMSNLARQEMYFDHFQDIDELIEKIEAVTVEDLQALAQEFFKTESIAVTALGNLNGLKISRDQLAC